MLVEDAMVLKSCDLGQTEDMHYLFGAEPGSWCDIAILVDGTDVVVWHAGGTSAYPETHPDRLPYALTDAEPQVGASTIRLDGADANIAWPWVSWCDSEISRSEVMGYVESYRAWRSVMTGIDRIYE